MKNSKKEKPPIDRVQTTYDAGLTKKEVDERVQKGYVNVTQDPNQKTVLQIIANNTFTFFNIVLFVIASVFIGFMIYLNAIGRSDIVNSYFGFSKFVFLIPAIMNVCMGSFQEYQSMKTIQKLKIVTSTKSKVVRDGNIESVDASEIVLDDIVALSAGEQATADLIVLSGEVEVDESMLTGESDHIKKTEGDTILSGSSIIVGSARCRADKIGDDTYAAELTRKVKNSSGHKSELMSSIMKIIKVLTVCLCFAIITATVTLAVKISATGNDPTIWNGLTLSLKDPVTWSLIVLTDGMFGVGMIPSGLVLTTSVALMVSIAGLTKKQTLVQELYSLENLSRVDVICLDKTGTLTDGTMSVFEIKKFDDDAEKHIRVLMGATDERNATSEAVFQYFGADQSTDIRELIPFSSANKYSGIVYNNGQKLLMGAPEYLLPKDDERLEYVTERAKEGNRVIAVKLDDKLIAFIAIEDHIRDTAAGTLKFFRENGVTVKVISGDNPLTPLEDIPSIAEEYTVFARVSPEQKEALVMALQANKHKVAMTGDGVNDILALRRSDSSITFAKASEAAKSCSDVILLDNDFSHLKEVVGEGRRVIGNTQKTSVLYLMKSIAVFILAFALIPFAKGQMWFSIENMYMLEAAVIGTGGFLLSLEPRRTPVSGSFLKKIVSQAICAGALGAIAVLLPILLNVVPQALGNAPVITDINVRPMMTVLLSIAGIIVVFSMCIPFNKYRAIALTCVVAVAATLGLLLPSAYIGGSTIGGDMLAYNKAAGQSIFDSQLAQEVFRPMNSPLVRELVGDPNNYIVLRMFLYVAIPLFIIIRFTLESKLDENDPDRNLNRSYVFGKRLILASGLVLILHAMLSIVEVLTNTGSFLTESLLGDGNTAVYFNIFYAVVYIIVGALGYRMWTNPTKRLTTITFIAGMVLISLAMAPMTASGSEEVTQSALMIIDSAVASAVVLAYFIGCSLIFLNIISTNDNKPTLATSQE